MSKIFCSKRRSPDGKLVPTRHPITPVIAERYGAVQHYMAAGFSVVPLIGGSKKPARGFRELMARAMPDAQVENWWTRWDVNIGIICGRVSDDLVVIDIEPEHVAWARANPALPTCPMVWTARGGLHLYCRGQLRTSKLRVDGRVVGDIKGEGGYVVAPPSIIGGSRYEWRGHGLEVTRPPVPEWALASSGGPNRGRAVDPPPRLLGPPPSARVHELVRLLPSNLSRVAEQGWREDGAFPTRNEADFAILIALAHLGASLDEAVAIFESFPIGDKYRDPGNGLRYLRHQYAHAMLAAKEDRAAAVSVRFVERSIYLGTLPGGARVRAGVTVELPNHRRVAGVIPVVLGPPHDGELAGEWVEIVRAFGAEPCGERPYTTKWNAHALAVLRRGQQFPRRFLEADAEVRR